MIEKAMSFKGNLKKQKYFEGWYYKFVSKDRKHTLSIIPGISLNKEDSHAFVQVVYSNIDNNKNENLITAYVRLAKNVFNYNHEENRVELGTSFFGLKTVSMNLESKEISLAGKIELDNLIKVRTNILSPTIMGYFSYVPFMECNHEVVSMDHDLRGKIEINGKVVDFTGGKGYIEKDFGRSFPVSYIWLQTNTFETDKTSFMFSYATIPFLLFKFKGLIANLVIRDKEYRFATYNLSTVKILRLEDDHLRLMIKKRRYLMEVDVSYDKTHVLPAPKKGKMNQTINESLMGEIKIRLLHKGDLLYEGKGSNAGVEIMLKQANDQ